MYDDERNAVGKCSVAIGEIMKINVTERDIELGARGTTVACPIALAIKRRTKKAVHVGTWTARIGQVRFKLPEEAINFVACFDRNVYVKPFKFNLGDLYVQKKK